MNTPTIELTLTLEQDERHFRLGPVGDHVKLRTLQPSPSRGGWPGNAAVLLEWQICPMGCSTYRPCTQTEVLRFEQLLGERREVRFLRHPTLGEVATPTA